MMIRMIFTCFINNLRTRNLLLLILIGVPLSAFGKGESITLWVRNFDTAPVNEVLELALKKTEDLYPPLKIQRSRPMEYPEALNSLKQQNALDVLSAASSQENDTELYPIPFPVLKGLLGYRICLIRKGDQSRFDNISTVFDFSVNQLKICQGKFWPDTSILKRNGLSVTTDIAYKPLFNKLKTGKCDCFLRGAQEVISEYEKYETEVDIEKKLIIHYPQPGFFYVNRKNKALAARIELGLLRALDDGDFEILFQNLMGEQLNLLNLKDRTTLQLNYPHISDVNRSIQKTSILWHQK